MASLLKKREWSNEVSTALVAGLSDSQGDTILRKIKH